MEQIRARTAGGRRLSQFVVSSKREAGAFRHHECGAGILQARDRPDFNRESLTHTVGFSWNFRRNTDFFLNARNVLNQDGGTYRGRSDLRTRWVETGAIWATGVRSTF